MSHRNRLYHETSDGEQPSQEMKLFALHVLAHSTIPASVGLDTFADALQHLYLPVVPMDGSAPAFMQ